MVTKHNATLREKNLTVWKLIQWLPNKLTPLIWNNVHVLLPPPPPPSNVIPYCTTFNNYIKFRLWRSIKSLVWNKPGMLVSVRHHILWSTPSPSYHGAADRVSSPLGQGQPTQRCACRSCSNFLGRRAGRIGRCLGWKWVTVCTHICSYYK